MSAHVSYAIENEDLASWMDAGGQVTDEDCVPAEFQRANRAGADYDLSGSLSVGTRAIA